MDRHRHRCGYAFSDPNPDRPGCGLVIEHDPDFEDVTHACTNCGVITTWRYSGPLLAGEGLVARAPVAEPKKPRRRRRPLQAIIDQLRLF